MQIKYLGTGAAEGIPALFCNCQYCTEVKRRGGKEIRSRSQVLLDGELSLDFPPDAFYHAAFFGADFSAIKYLIVTHSHMDHFYASDFILRGYKYASNLTSPTLDVYGNSETIEVFQESTRREIRPEVRESIRLHEMKAFSRTEFGGYTVHPLKAQHSSREPLLYLIEKDGKRVLHLTDTGRLTEESLAYLQSLGGAPLDLITLDCTFLWSETQPSARHMGLDENVRTLESLIKLGLADGHTKKVITHFSHNAVPSAESLERAEREYGVIAAYDGLELEI